MLFRSHGNSGSMPLSVTGIKTLLETLPTVNLSLVDHIPFVIRILSIIHDRLLTQIVYGPAVSMQ